MVGIAEASKIHVISNVKNKIAGCLQASRGILATYKEMTHKGHHKFTVLESEHNHVTIIYLFIVLLMSRSSLQGFFSACLKDLPNIQTKAIKFKDLRMVSTQQLRINAVCTVFDTASH